MEKVKVMLSLMICDPQMTKNWKGNVQSEIL